jgi:hypothetical protein
VGTTTTESSLRRLRWISWTAFALAGTVFAVGAVLAFFGVRLPNTPIVIGLMLLFAIGFVARDKSQTRGGSNRPP